MRRLTSEKALWELMRILGPEAPVPTRAYFTGGATAVLMGWRDTTIDVDLRFVPETDELLRAVPRLKDTLQLNLEFAWPPDFIPELPGWETRSVYITSEAKISFFHYDLYSQTLSKIERSHSQDVTDVEELIQRGQIDRGLLLELFQAIEPNLYRYPAIDPPSFRRAVEAVVS